jgi:hypothetical protein
MIYPYGFNFTPQGNCWPQGYIPFFGSVCPSPSASNSFLTDFCIENPKLFLTN